MDHIDRKIIDLLQNNARAPLKEIADHVFCPAPPCRPAWPGWKAPAPSPATRHQVDAPKLGYMVKAFINLDMDPQRKPEFYPYIQSLPPCGGMQLRHRRLQYADRGAVRYDAGAGSVHQHLQQFGRTRTQIVFSTPVEHRGVPVAEPEEKQ